MMTTLTVEFDLHFARGRHRRTAAVEAKKPVKAPSPGRVLRVARLLALAIKLENQIRRGELRDFAEVARVGHVSRARITQIMGLLNLAPDIQEAILLAPLVVRGRDPLCEQHLRRLAAQDDWRRQRRSWASIARRLPSESES
jgi:hypothetical protein